jgi:hypothetical protein
VSLYRAAWRRWGQVANQLGPEWVRVRFAALVVVEQVPSPLAMGKDGIGEETDKRRCRRRGAGARN